MSLVVDLFAAGGGWDEGLRLAGHEGPVVGLELDDAACRTAVAAGHARIRCDVAAYPTEPFAGKVDGLIASPPCTTFSKAGKRAGFDDPRGLLSHEPLRWARDLRPRWVALEQVPEVLPHWRHVAHELRLIGYSTWTGVLCAADYGVPQTRRRAILVARRDGLACAPTATHSERAEEGLFGDTPRWVTMAEALGWDGYTLHQTRGAGMVERYGDRADREMSEPAFTITAGSKGSGPRMEWQLKRDRGDGLIERHGDREGRGLDQPAFTVTAGSGGVGTRMSWVMYAAGQTSGESAGVQPRKPSEPSEPSATITGKGTAAWVYERPSTTVCADPRIGRPGHKDRESGDAQFARDSVRVTVAEAAVLQGFRRDYPWQGTKTQQYQQVGNAIPPPLAAAILAPLLTARRAVAA